jgi:hypothetical protein
MASANRTPKSAELTEDPSTVMAKNESAPAEASGLEDWRDLARRIQNETDSTVMIDLIQQLLTKLDAEAAGKKKP